MTKFARVLIAVSALLGAVAYICVPQAVDAGPAYGSHVSRVEHLGPRIDTFGGRCVRGVFSTTPDANGFLTGEPDAGAPGSDAALWRPGADAAAWVAPEVMGPRPLPSSGVNYQCYAATNRACWRQGAVAESCVYTASFPADQNTAPFAFMPEADGGRPKVYVIAESGTTTVECCAVIPSVLSGNY